MQTEIEIAKSLLWLENKTWNDAETDGWKEALRWVLETKK